MKKLNKILFIPLILTAIIIVISTISFAAEPEVSLGTTSSFAVLAGTTITNIGATTITGNVGLYPGTSYTGSTSVIMTGETHINDTIADIVKTDLVTAYNDADGRSVVTTIASELGETILFPGVYDSADGKFQITGTLTLDSQGDPNAVFIFKSASTLITASNSDINLINSANPCHIFWKVGSSATLGTNSNFSGSIIALTSITANNGASIRGKLFARNGAVTLENNIIITVNCQNIPLPEIIPEVIIDDNTAVIIPDSNITIETNQADVVKKTVVGGQLPRTGTPLYNIMISGVVLIIIGVTIGLISRKKHE